jgi:hypothetical protein
MSLLASSLVACGEPPVPGTWTIAASMGSVDNVFDGDGNAPASKTTEADEVEDAGTIAMVEDGTGTVTLTKTWAGITDHVFVDVPAEPGLSGPLEWIYSTLEEKPKLALITEVDLVDMNQEWTVTSSGFDFLDLEYFRNDEFSPTQRAITHRTMHLVRSDD